MGSFFSQCSVTGLNIPDNAELVRLLLLPRFSEVPSKNLYTEEFPYDKGLHLSNDVPWANWVPFGFPLKGTYDDYGTISSVEEDENIKKLEEYFNISFDLILRAVHDTRWIQVLESEDEYYKRQRPNSPYLEVTNLDKLKKLTYTDIKRDVYDRLVEMSDKLGKRNWWSGQYTYEQWLDYYNRISEFRKEYSEDFEEVEEYLTFKAHSEVKSFVPSYSFNFIHKLGYGEEFSGVYKEYARFSYSMTQLNKWIESSKYGTQELNYEEFIELYEPILENAKQELEEYNNW